MSTAKLLKDTTITYLANLGPGAAQEITIPAGSAVHQVDGRWVVSSEALLVKLTGNAHDPKYRYAWLPEGVEVVLPERG